MDAVHVAVGATICESHHQCPCGAEVDARGFHGLSCEGGSGRSARHHSLNDLVWCGLSTANIPATKEPSNLLKSDGKRHDGLTLIPWKNGRCVTWDVTVTDTLAQSYLPATRSSSGAADNRKLATTDSWRSHTFSYHAVAIETLGHINNAGLGFLSDLGRRISQVSSDNRESAFLFQRLSVLIQRFSAVAIQCIFAHIPTALSTRFSRSSFF